MERDARRLVIYHANCWDGAAAAWAFQQHPDWRRAELVPAQYGDEPPTVAGAHVAIVDFSYERQRLLAMHEAAESIVVLDHHETAEATLRGLDFCIFDRTRSGAGLAWDWLWSLPDRAPAATPAVLRYIEDRDLWRFALPCSRLVNEYIRTHPCTPESVGKLHREAIRVGIKAFAERGQAVARRSELMVEDAMRHARDLAIAGVRGRIANLPVASLISATCSALAAAGRSWGGAWFLARDGVSVSLRSVDGRPNVAQIAQQFGGGGHPGAAGFVVPLPRFLQALESGRLDP